MDWQKNKQHIRNDFARDGYVVLRGFFSPPEMKELMAQLDRYIAEVVPHLPADKNFFEIKGQVETLKYAGNMDLHDPYFRKLYEGGGFVELAEWLMDGPVVGKNLSLFNKPPRVGDKTPPHQDGYYFMLDPMEALTLWLAIDLVDAENGCVRYVTGSHRKGMRPHQRTQTLGFSQGISDYGTAEDQQNEVAISAQPGDLLAHHCLTIHRADANRSSRTRRALGVVYNSARARENKQALEEYGKTLKKELAGAGKV